MSDLLTGQDARAPWGARWASACVAAAVGAALVAPLAHADTLSDLREQVGATRSSQQDARAEVAESRDRMSAATQALADSQARLDAARAELGDIRVELAAAREHDAHLAASLQAARTELEAARERVARGQAEVDARVALIGHAARESFQQQTDLRALSVLFGSESPAEMSQRLQWNTTVFDTQASEKARLDGVLAELEAARAAQADVEARIAADKEASARNVERIGDLEGRARAQQAAVAALVSANEQARGAAQLELDADEAAYRTLRADEDRLQGEIRAEIGRMRAAEAAERQQADAEAKRRAAEREQARRSAAADAASTGRAAQPAPEAAQRRDGSGTERATSATGFIRPVAASPGSRFGLRYHPILKYWRPHNGVDYGAPTGTPLYAAKDGTVMQAGPNGGFGNFVLIGHGDVGGRYVTTGYAHLSGITVRAGQKVTRGQLIGHVGSTGLSTSPHLHLEVRLDGTPANPLLHIP